jgi:hypothetical protein
VKTSEQQKTP